MTVAVHPATSLPEADRVAYLRAVASVSLADGRAANAELAKLKRLAKTLELQPAVFDKLLAELRAQQSSGIDEGLRLAGADEVIRSSLMTDAIVIAFVDGKLDRGESRMLHDLARQLSFTDDEVLQIASFVERVLFKREEADAQSLAKEFGSVLSGGGKAGWFGWIGSVFRG
jgi:tellurite resistance protein